MVALILLLDMGGRSGPHRFRLMVKRADINSSTAAALERTLGGILLLHGFPLPGGVVPFRLKSVSPKPGPQAPSSVATFKLLFLLMFFVPTPLRSFKIPLRSWSAGPFSALSC